MLFSREYLSLVMMAVLVAAYSPLALQAIHECMRWNTRLCIVVKVNVN